MSTFTNHVDLILFNFDFVFFAYHNIQSLLLNVRFLWIIEFLEFVDCPLFLNTKFRKLDLFPSSGVGQGAHTQSLSEASSF
jgi:hypothetical protein